MELCRDPKTASTWQVITETCQPGRVAEATRDSFPEARGLHIKTRRTVTGG